MRSLAKFCFVISVILMGALFCGAEIVIVKDGIPAAAVVLSDSPTPGARLAAEELVSHVEKASGARLPVVGESDIPGEYASRIFIGATEAAINRGIRPEELGAEQSVLLSTDSEVFVTGKETGGLDPTNLFFLSAGHATRDELSCSGTLYGVYELLERCLGVVWAWPGDLGTYIPKTDNIVIARGLDETFEPGFEWRYLGWGFIWDRLRGGDYDPGIKRFGFSQQGLERYGEDLKYYLRRHRQGGKKPRFRHEFHDWWERYGEENPEWFGLHEGGERGPVSGNVSVMCVSNPDLSDFIVENWPLTDEAWRRADPEKFITLGESDRRWICTCENCREWDVPPPEPGDLPEFFVEDGEIRERSFYNFPGWTSDRYARFWRTVYDMAKRENPDIVVTTYLYYSYFPAPAEFTDLAPGIYGEFVHWGDRYLDFFPMREDAFEWLKEQWLGWKNTGITMAYRPNYLHDAWIMPHSETRQTGEFLEFAYENGMVGTSYDSLYGQWSAHGPKLYLHARFNSKPGLGAEKILDEYYSVFGPAEEHVREYFEYWEEYVYENKERFIELLPRGRWQRFQQQAHQAYPRECFPPAEEILGRAAAAAEADPNPEYLERVEFLKLGLRHAMLGRELAAQFDGESNISRDSYRFQRARRILEALINFRKENEDSYISDFSSIARKELWHWNLNDLVE